MENSSSNTSLPALSAMARLQIAFLTWKRYLQKVLEPHGITLKQAFVLERLSQQGALHPSKIASMLFCDRPTATVILKNLQRREWVAMQPDHTDRRQTLVQLSSQGQTKLEEIRQTPWGTRGTKNDPLACFTAQELDQFDMLLRKLNQHLREMTSSER